MKLLKRQINQPHSVETRNKRTPVKQKTVNRNSVKGFAVDIVINPQAMKMNFFQGKMEWFWRPEKLVSVMKKRVQMHLAMILVTQMGEVTDFPRGSDDEVAAPPSNSTGPTLLDSAQSKELEDLILKDDGFLARLIQKKKELMSVERGNENKLKYRDYLSRQVVFRFTFDVVLLKAQREMAKIADFDENRRF